MTTINATIAADADDGQWNGSAIVSSGNNLAFGVGTAAYFRFTGLAIPQGSTITSATFTTKANSSKSVSSTCNLFGHAVDNATNPATDPAGLPQTTATVTGTTYASTASGQSAAKTVTSIVQEIVNRAGWVSGNALSILVVTTSTPGSAYLAWARGSGNSSNLGTLDVDYAAGGAAAPTVFPRRPLRGLIVRGRR